MTTYIGQCPTCQAAPGQPCTSKTGKRATETHRSRAADARTTQHASEEAINAALAAGEAATEQPEKDESEPEPATPAPVHQYGFFAPEMDHLTAVLLGHLAPGGHDNLRAQLAKLQEEVDEVRDEFDPAAVLAELADVVVVAHTAAATLGYGADDVFRAVLAKMRVNAARKWGTLGSVGKHC